MGHLTLGNLSIEFEVDGKPYKGIDAITITVERDEVDVTSFGSSRRIVVPAAPAVKTIELQLHGGIIEGYVVNDKMVVDQPKDETRYEMAVRPTRCEITSGMGGNPKKVHELFDALSNDSALVAITKPDRTLNDKARARAIAEAPTPEIRAAIEELYRMDDEASARGEVLVADVEYDDFGVPVFKPRVLDA